MAEQRAKDKKTKKIEEAVKNFTKLERIETLKEGLNDLEAVLEVEGADEDDWLRHLKTVLRGKPAEILQSLHVPPDIPCGEAKDDLFHKCGITAKRAGENLFKPDMEQWMRRDSSQMIDDLYQWVNRISGTETTKAEAIHNIVKEVWRSWLNSEARRFWDSKSADVKTRRELNDMALNLYESTGHPSKACHYCGDYSHKS